MSLADRTGGRFSAALGLALAAWVLAAPSAQAGGFDRWWERHLERHSRAWCAYYSGQSSSVECSFDTYAQCRAAVSGVGGFCGQNPDYAALVDPPGRRGYNRRYAPR